MGRRLALTSLLVLLPPDSQMLVALLLGFVGIIGTQKIMPHWSPLADSLQYACSWLIFGCMVSMMLMEIGMGEGSQILMSTTLFLGVACIVVWNVMNRDDKSGSGTQASNQVAPAQGSMASDGPAEPEATRVDEDEGGTFRLHLESLSLDEEQAREAVPSHCRTTTREELSTTVLEEALSTPRLAGLRRVRR